MILWQDIHAAIDQAEAIVLVTHENPDGDGLGSELALYHALVQYGKKVYIHNYSPVPRIYRFLAGSDVITHGCDFQPDSTVDLMISLDCGDQKRLSMPRSFFDQRLLINIDHHDTNNYFGQLNHIQKDACATGFMIYELIGVLGITISAAMAQSLYVTLLTDTGSFRYPCSSSYVYRLAAILIDAGAEPWPIAVEVYESATPGRMRLLAACLSTLKMTFDARVAWLRIDQAMYQATDSDVEDTEGLIDYGRCIQYVEIAVLIREESQDFWKVTFRGKLDTHVGELAQMLGGGGHAYASGCALCGSYDEVFAQVHDVIRSSLDTSS
ncbi:MAG: bifunctional oligoribonuclease/PAP phosphatase NrnA [Mariprofundaceae bacterium]|nr:bifunctional oligoribonuclease/PAP phosphatase NrnA [Mariprofundaceae bacterium]